MVPVPAAPLVRVDSHVHVLNLSLSPDEFATGSRIGLSRTEMALLGRIAKLARKVDLPEPADEVVGIVDEVLEAVPWSSQRWKGLKELLRLYVLPTRQAVASLYETLYGNGVRLACLLVPDSPGLTYGEIDQLISEVDHMNAWSTPVVKVFVPWRFWHLVQGRACVGGVKSYPSMDRIPLYREEIAPPQCVITHCSPGGVRRLGMPEALATVLNAPGRWHDALLSHRIRLCMAHAGGLRQFMRWFLRDYRTPGLNWSLDNLMRSTSPGLAEWPGRLWADLAFHERMFEADYAEAIAHLTPWWNLLPGTDFPLHLPFYPYSRAVARVNELIPDGADQLGRFLVGEL